MEPILKKSEIAHLLTSLKDDLVYLDSDDEDQKEIRLKSKPVNLTNIRHIEGEQFRIPNLDIILDAFCSAYATSLTNNLQRTFSVTRTALESTAFQSFFKNKDFIGANGIINMSPLKGVALIMVDQKLSFSLLETMLGASSQVDSVHLERRLTTIELVILKSIFTDACRDLNKSFSQVLHLQSSLLKLESSARLVSIVEPTAEVIIATLQARAGDKAGEIYMIFPFSTLEPLRDPLKDFLNLARANTSNWYEVIEKEILELPAVVTAQSGTIRLSVSQILALETGDILNLNYDPSSPINVLVEGQHGFYAVSGTHKGKKAISLIGPVQEQ